VAYAQQVVGDEVHVRDHGLLESAAARPQAPDRVVVDAHTADVHPEIAGTARQAGLPMLIDPETFYLQGQQHPGDPWARLPFAAAAPTTVAGLLDDGRAGRLVAESLEFQLARGATALIAPYVHVERAGDGWAEVQVVLHQQTRHYLDAQGLNLDVIAPVAMGWRLVGRTAWPQAMDRIMVGLQELAPTEVALAASKIDQGAHPDQRLADLYAAIGRMLAVAGPRLATAGPGGGVCGCRRSRL